jgi:cupin-like protein
MRIEVPRIDHRELGFDRFLREFFEPELPVVVTGVARDWPARTRWTAQSVRAALASSPKTRSPGRKLWLENDRELLRDDIVMPAFVERALDARYTSSRSTDCRYWIHEAANVTHWHFDANSLFVFNVQVIGKKQFTLVSPASPLPSYPFTATTSVAAERERHRYAHACTHAIVELDEGDLLFMPAYWQHRVRALADSINVNWVGTRRGVPTPSASATREREILRLAQLVPRLAPALSRWITFGGSASYFDDYAGIDGRRYVDDVTRDIPRRRAIARGIAEGLAAIRLLINGGERPMVKAPIFEGEA